MADDYVRVPEDDMGKKLQTHKNTIGVDDVHAEAVVPSESDGSELAKAEDAAHSSGDKGSLVLAVRQDDIDTLTSADGDYAALKVNKRGEQYVDVEPFHIIDQCNATAGWAALNTDTLNLTTDANHVCGTASLEFDKVDGAANTVFGCIDKTLVAVKLGPYTRGGGFLLWSLYVSTLADIAYAFIRLGTDNANYNEWRIDDDQLSVSWNHIRMPVNSPSFAGSTGNGWNPASITYIAVGVAFDAQDDTLADILVDKIQICSGLQTSADITAQVTSEVSSPNVIVRAWGSAVDTDSGNASNNTLRVAIADDDTNLAAIDLHSRATYTSTDFDAAADGNLVAAGGAGVVTKIHYLRIQTHGSVTVNIEDGNGGASLWEFKGEDREGDESPWVPVPAQIIKSSANTALYVNLSAAVTVVINATYSQA